MSTTAPQLAFGYNPGLSGATCAWGARWIIRQDGDVDQLYDRQDMIGTPEERSALADWLNRVVAGRARDRLSEMLRSNAVSTRTSQEVILYEDGVGIVLGNANSSAGYFYVIARFKQ